MRRRGGIAAAGSADGKDSQHDAWLSAANEILKELQINAVVIGGVAAITYRDKGRVTQDLDLLVPSLDGLADALEKRGYETTSYFDDDHQLFLLRAHMDKNFFDFTLAETKYQTTALSRAKGGFITREDVILQKLMAWRSRDREDVKSILRTGAKLDQKYIAKWVKSIDEESDGFFDLADRWTSIQE